jgi:cyclic pyranopterin phosphate synthase
VKDRLVDSFGRCIDYLRVSITDLCSLRCTYCRPPEGVELTTHEEILRYEEILTIVSVARDLGVRKIRVTGGEPLVRRGVVDFVSRLTALEGIEDVGLTTNATLLSPLAAELRAAGLRRINISLDSLDRETFRRITGQDKLSSVIEGIRIALEIGFQPVKINVVLLRGVNEPDIPQLARLTINHPLDVRFIERMPFGNEVLPNAPSPFSAGKALEIVRREVGEPKRVSSGPLDGPATMFRLEGAKGRIGIIDPVTGHFCGTCNRLRLTATGTLRPCLLGDREIDIKSALRAGASKRELARIIRQAVDAKPLGRLISNNALKERMNRIGG